MELARPERDGRLDAIDRRAAGGECLGAVRRGSDDGDGDLTHGKHSDAMDDLNAGVRPVAGEALRNASDLRLRHRAVRLIFDPFRAAAGVLVADDTQKSADAPVGGTRGRDHRGDVDRTLGQIHLRRRPFSASRDGREKSDLVAVGEDRVGTGVGGVDGGRRHRARARQGGHLGDELPPQIRDPRPGANRPLFLVAAGGVAEGGEVEDADGHGRRSVRRRELLTSDRLVR